MILNQQDLLPEALGRQDRSAPTIRAISFVHWGSRSLASCQSNLTRRGEDESSHLPYIAHSSLARESCIPPPFYHSRAAVMDQGDVIYPMVITVEGLNAYVLQFLQGVVVVINRSLKKKVSAIKILSVNTAMDHVQAGDLCFTTRPSWSPPTTPHRF